MHTHSVSSIGAYAVTYSIVLSYTVTHTHTIDSSTVHVIKQIIASLKPNKYLASVAGQEFTRHSTQTIIPINAHAYNMLKRSKNDIAFPNDIIPLV